MLTRLFIIAAGCAAIVWGQTAAPASLTVTGDITTPLTLKAEDLAAMPREKVSIPDPNGIPVEYEGVNLREILKKAGAPLDGALRGAALTTYVLAKAHDGYQVVFALAELDLAFGNEKIVVADKRDGKALPDGQGPLRLVCPNDHAGARSVRLLETLEVVRLKK